MYQKMEEILGIKQETIKTKDVHVYIWNGQKIHFRGPTGFTEEERIEVRIDKDDKKMLFINDGNNVKYSKKFTLENKLGSGNISFKKALTLLNFNGSCSFKAEKLSEEDLIDLGILPNIIAYEIDLKKPLPQKLKTPKKIIQKTV